MAGQTIASFSLSATSTTAAIMPAVPAGKAESVSLMAALPPGATADGYLNVYLVDPVSAPSGAFLLFQEPIRYRQPGGNPVLLMNFVVPAGANISVQEALGVGSIHCTLFNRWRFDPVAGQNMPTTVFPVSGVAQTNALTVPSAKAESVSVMVASASGLAVDAYADVALVDPVSAPGGVSLLTLEPVRFRAAGGSPVLLLNYVVSAGCQLFVKSAIAGQILHFTMFNRWRFDA